LGKHPQATATLLAWKVGVAGEWVPEAVPAVERDPWLFDVSELTKYARVINISGASRFLQGQDSPP
jgi:hypothetical protein